MTQRLTPHYRDIMRHVLGLGYSATPCRNFIHAYERSIDLPDLFALQRAGLLQREPVNMEGYVFTATPLGIHLATQEEEREILQDPDGRLPVLPNPGSDRPDEQVALSPSVPSDT